MEKAFHGTHGNVGTALANLAALYWAQGRYAEAEPHVRRALAIAENSLGPDHPDVGKALSNLATLYFEQRNWARAADFWRRSAGVTVRRAQRGTDDVGRALTGRRTGEAEQESDLFSSLVKATHRLASEGRNAEAGLSGEMFQTAQWARRLGSGGLAGADGRTRRQGRCWAQPAIVRERQDLVAEWQKRDGARSAAVSQAPDKRDSAAEAANVARLAAIDMRIAAIDKRLAADFPDYAALSRPRPLSVEEVQSQLRPDEALVLVLDTPEQKPTPEETFIWVVTKTEMRWVRSELGTRALTREVAALRCGLDAAAWEGEGAAKCAGLLRSTDTVPKGNAPLPFDVARAHALYTALFGQVEDLIRDKHLLIVPPAR